MAEEDLNTEEQEDQPQAFDVEESLRKQVKALERKLAKSESERVFAGLKVKYPHITEEDFEGVKPERWEHIASRIAAPQSEEPPQAEIQPEAPVTPEVKQAVRAFTAAAPQQAVAEEIVSGKEALAKVKSGEWTDADYQANAARRATATR